MKKFAGICTESNYKLYKHLVEMRYDAVGIKNPYIHKIVKSYYYEY